MPPRKMLPPILHVGQLPRNDFIMTSPVLYAIAWLTAIFTNGLDGHDGDYDTFTTTYARERGEKFMPIIITALIRRAPATPPLVESMYCLQIASFAMRDAFDAATISAFSPPARAVSLPKPLYFAHQHAARPRCCRSIQQALYRHRARWLAGISSYYFAGKALSATSYMNDSRR